MPSEQGINIGAGADEGSRASFGKKTPGRKVNSAAAGVVARWCQTEALAARPWPLGLACGRRFPPAAAAHYCFEPL
jgi:hypothetical protein